MQGLTEKIAAIISEANRNEAVRNQLLQDPVTFLKAKDVNVPDPSYVDISYTPGYGLFLGIDTRFTTEVSQNPMTQKDKDINADHFSDCLHY
ncbi:hypothetical protein Lsan_3379 [Legionella santicrucis]|uniref:Uncharacterized protein n=1 Tax=Legionella santicrucis TaxID=45074 RepID=A0A0W0YH43_9GAMM|nr:hypothetical protein [Legionella santicrucis]KTD55827.1 hypothetical protein Lsan_3379 [Legionella santicrucis]